MYGRADGIPNVPYSVVVCCKVWYAKAIYICWNCSGIEQESLVEADPLPAAYSVSTLGSISIVNSALMELILGSADHIT